MISRGCGTQATLGVDDLSQNGYGGGGGGGSDDSRHGESILARADDAPNQKGN